MKLSDVRSLNRLERVLNEAKIEEGRYGGRYVVFKDNEIKDGVSINAVIRQMEKICKKHGRGVELSVQDQQRVENICVRLRELHKSMPKTSKTFLTAIKRFFSKDIKKKKRLMLDDHSAGVGKLKTSLNALSVKSPKPIEPCCAGCTTINGFNLMDPEIKRPLSECISSKNSKAKLNGALKDLSSIKLEDAHSYVSGRLTMVERQLADLTKRYDLAADTRNLTFRLSPNEWKNLGQKVDQKRENIQKKGISERILIGPPPVKGFSSEFDGRVYYDDQNVPIDSMTNEEIGDEIRSLEIRYSMLNEQILMFSALAGAQNIKMEDLLYRPCLACRRFLMSYNNLTKITKALPETITDKGLLQEKEFIVNVTEGFLNTGVKAFSLIKEVIDEETEITI